MTRYDTPRGHDTDRNIIDENVVGPVREPVGDVSYENVDAVFTDIEETGSIEASLEERSYEEPSIEATETTDTYDDLEEGNPFADDPVTGTRNDLLL